LIGNKVAYAVNLKHPTLRISGFRYAVEAVIMLGGEIVFTVIKEKRTAKAEKGLVITSKTRGIYCNIHGVPVRIWYEKNKLIFHTLREDAVELTYKLAEYVERKINYGRKFLK